MKQVFQSYKDGRLKVVDVPAAKPRPGHLLMRTVASLVSAGTEKYMLEMGGRSLLGKALARPDLVRQVLAKARAEGMGEAYRQAMGRLDAPVPLGYSSAGIVEQAGPGVTGFADGDRVACAGPGAGHAEIACVAANLCARIPEGVGFEQAAFVALGGIALEAFRMARVSLGETVAVIGLGLIGQIAVQLLNAAGCHVIGMDPDAQKAGMARLHGAETAASDYLELLQLCRGQTAGHGVDAALIFASTESNEPLERAAELCRERGRIVAAGLVGLEVPRKIFYEKEVELVVSRAWGPGLYDADYAEKGHDYPLAYARWTAKRNMEEFLAQLAKGTVSVDHLVTHRFPFERAIEAYELVLANKAPYIGVLFNYDGLQAGPGPRRIDLLPATASSNSRPQERVEKSVSFGLIGAGQFAKGTLLPAMKGINGISLAGVAAASGLSARHLADRFGFRYCTTDYQELLDDRHVDLLCILTRHDSHAELLAKALQAGKHVFVEKPMALTADQLQAVIEAYELAARPKAAGNGNKPLPVVMVGFNRRFSPFTRWIKARFGTVGEPLTVHCAVNAGAVPADSWVHDPEQGGGRIAGEVCHFVDLIQYLTGSLPARVYAETLDSDGYQPSDNLVITLKMANGALGSISYLAGGDKRYPRERVEVIGGGAVGVIDNFRAASFTRNGRTRRIRNWLSVDRGHRAEIEALVDCIRRDGPPPVAFEEYVYTTLATFAIEQALRDQAPIAVVPATTNSPTVHEAWISGPGSAGVSPAGSQTA